MQQSAVILIFIIAIIAVLFFVGLRQRREEQRRLTLRLQDQFGRDPRRDERRITGERMNEVPGYFRHHPAPFQLDDITWNDLEMDELYQRLCNTQSAAGEEYLYYLLRTPALTKEQEKLSESQIRFFDENEEVRLSVQKRLWRLGHTGKYSIYSYLDLLDGLSAGSAAKHYIAAGLLLTSIVLMIAFGEYAILLFIAALVYDFASYFRTKREIEPYVTSFAYLLRMIDAARDLGECLSAANASAFEEDLHALRRLSGPLQKFSRGSWILMGKSETGAGNPIDVVLDYIRILLHLDLIKFHQMLGLVKSNQTEFDEMITMIGRIDAAIAVASFRKSLTEGFCEPVFTEVTYHAEDLYHPLITQPVKNSIRCSSQKGVLITGSNASGKSTFLKAAAICALFAQTIRTVPAAEYTAERFRIYTSMALRDDLERKESYFIVEIKSLKRILDAAGTGPVLAFVDEVLRGTNTVERIAASTEVLEGFVRAGALCFAATHDIELTQLLEDSYDNYHFEEELQDGDVVFHYQLREGRSATRNAIRLLSAIGYREDIVAQAQKRAEKFMRTGAWSV